MERRVLELVKEEVSLIKPFDDSSTYYIEDLADAFSTFASNYDSFETAIDNLPNFISQYYTGNNVTKFKDTLRMGYSEIVQALFDGKRADLEKRVIRSI
jgi:hypothetical protein